MITYEQWNKAIISYFFEECEPNQIVFLQTNLETLSEIAEHANLDVRDAAESLKEAVRRKMVFSGTVLLSSVSPEPLLWNNYSGEEPPQVAFLALTVFAASLMEAEGSVASSNYYSRLNEVLFGQLVKGDPPGFDRSTFKDFWEHLQRWLRNEHDVELYLTQGSSSSKYVWYPISQCLIRKQDRRDIYCFFRDHKLTPFSKISDDQLEKKFRPWLRHLRIERYFSNESHKKSILSQVRSLLKHWDGEIPPESPTGERQTTASVNVELRFDLSDNVKICYWFPTRGREATGCRTNALEIRHLQPSHLEKWFRPVSDKRNTFWNLPTRLQLQTDETKPITYTLGYSDIWVFRRDPERDDGWLSQRNMRRYEDHLILFRRELVNQVVDRLSKTCEQKIEEPNPIYVDDNENDWLYLRVKPIKLKSFSSQEFWKLSVDSGERIRLIDGLSVRDQHKRRAYLDICLPTVFVPDFGLPCEEPLQIDDKELSLNNEDRLVTLPNDLGQGVYQLTYGDQTKELRVIVPELSLKHIDRTLIASISDRTTIPAYTVKEIPEISEGSDIWLTGAKLLGDIPLSPIEDEEGFSQVPAHIISSVVKVAIDLKKNENPVPEWFDEAIKYLDQNVGLRSLVEKKLNRYHQTALSYAELRKQTGK